MSRFSEALSSLKTGLREDQPNVHVPIGVEALIRELKEREKARASLDPLNELKFSFDIGAHKALGEEKSRAALNRLLLFSSQAAVFVPKITYGYTPYAAKWWAGVPDELFQVGEWFELAIDRGHLSVFPDEILFWGGPDLDSNSPEMRADFGNNEIREHTVALSPGLLGPISRRKNKSARPVVDIRLPDLRNIAPELICKIREDEALEFIRFHQAMTSLLQHDPTAESEQKLLNVLAQVDEQVRALDKRFKKLARMQTLRAGGVMTGSVILSLSILLPELLPAYIQAAIGGKALLDLFEFVTSRGDVEEQLRGEEFFVPWKLHRASRGP